MKKRVRRTMLKNKKASYFFAIDAFIAGGILILTITLLLNFFSTQKPNKQTNSFLNDYAVFLRETTLLDISNPLIRTYDKQGLIKDNSLSLSKQIILLVYYNQTDSCPVDEENYCFEVAQNLTKDSLSSIPEEIGVRVSLKNSTDEKQLYASNEDIEDTSISKLVKNIIEYVYVNTTTIYGPVSLEVEMWS